MHISMRYIHLDLTCMHQDLALSSIPLALGRRISCEIKVEEVDLVGSHPMPRSLRIHFIESHAPKGDSAFERHGPNSRDDNREWQYPQYQYLRTAVLLGTSGHTGTTKIFHQWKWHPLVVSLLTSS